MRLLLIILALWVSPCWATDYYIKNTGDDSLDGTSDANAWRTIGKIQNATLFQPNDNIYINKGDSFTSNLTFVSSGTSAGRVRIGTYGTGDRPIVQGRIRFHNYSYWNISGLHLVTQATGMQSISIEHSNNITIADCYIQANVSGISGSVVKIQGDSTGIYAQDLIIKDSEITAFGTSSYGVGIDIKNYTRNIQVLNNTVHDGWEAGIQAMGDLNTWTVDNVTISDNKCYNISTAANAAHGINLGYAVSNITVTRNYCHDNNNTGIALDVNATNCIVANNIIDENGNAGICLWPNATNIKIYHNTINSSQASGFKWYATIGAGNEFKNNILNTDYQYFIFMNNLGTRTVTCDRNLFYNSFDDATYKTVWNNTEVSPNTFAAWKSASGLDSSSISDPPLLNADYSLQKTSPCVNVALSLNIKDDYVGTLRDVQPDIGAYEYYNTKVLNATLR